MRPVINVFSLIIKYTEEMIFSIINAPGYGLNSKDCHIKIKMCFYHINLARSKPIMSV